MSDKLVQREAGVLRELDSILKQNTALLGKYLKVSLPDLTARASEIEALNAEQEAAKGRGKEATKRVKELFGPAANLVGGSVDIIRGALKIAGAKDLIKEIPKQPSTRTFDVRLGFMTSFSQFVKKLRERFPKLPNVDLTSLASKLDALIAANTAMRQARSSTEAATEKLNLARAETMLVAGAWLGIARGIFELEKAKVQLDTLASVRLSRPKKPKAPAAQKPPQQ